MSRRASFISLTETQLEELKDDLKAATKSLRLRYRRRLQCIWFSTQGWTVSRLAKRLRLSERSVWKYRKVYQAKGLLGLKGKYFYRGL